MNSTKLNGIVVMEALAEENGGRDLNKKGPRSRVFRGFSGPLIFKKMSTLKNLSSWVLSVKSFVGYNALAITLVLVSIFKAENTKEVVKLVIGALKFPLIYFFLTFVLALIAFPFLQSSEFLKVWNIFLFSFIINFFLAMNILLTPEVKRDIGLMLLT